MHLLEHLVVLLQPVLPQPVQCLLHQLLLLQLLALPPRRQLHAVCRNWRRRGLVAAKEVLQDAAFMVAELPHVTLHLLGGHVFGLAGVLPA